MQGSGRGPLKPQEQLDLLQTRPGVYNLQKVLGGGGGGRRGGGGNGKM